MKIQYVFIVLLCLIILGSAVLLLIQPPPLRVIKTSPQENSSQNPFLPVTIYFNRAPKSGEVSYSVNPVTAFTVVETAGNGEQLVPNDTFEPSVAYKIVVNTAPPYILTFETEQVGSNPPNWNTEFQQQTQQYQQQFGAQDAALMNIRKNAPVTQPGFVVSYSYTNNTYTITLSPPYDQSKTAFLSWFTKLGVTDFTTVRLQYVNK